MLGSVCLSANKLDPIYLCTKQWHFNARIKMAELLRSSGDLLWQFQIAASCCCCCNCDDYIGWWRGNTHLRSRLNIIQPPQIRRGAALLCPATWQIESKWFAMFLLLRRWQTRVENLQVRKVSILLIQPLTPQCSLKPRVNCWQSQSVYLNYLNYANSAARYC